MRLAAIYIEGHDYVFQEPETLNFGGRHNYKFTTSGNNVYLQRNKNEKFIDGFFDQTNLSSQIKLISSIVGKNGSGKSSILDIIRSYFIRNQYGLPYSHSVAIIESDENELPLILHSDFESVEYRFNVVEIEKSKNYDLLSIELERLDKKDIQSLFYSPHFDFKYNLNFDDIDDYDLSFDKVLERDLEDLDNKGTGARGFRYSPTQELIFKNSLRQLSFLSSNLVKEHKVFENIFSLPKHGEAKLFFRGHNKEDPWNIPTDFKWALKSVKDKLEEEIKNWHEIRNFDKDHNITNQIYVNKYLAKRYLIRDIISVLERQMEKKNSYLSEGKILIPDFEESITDLDAFNSFIAFIENSKIQFQKSSWDAFHSESIRNLLNTLHTYIDEIDNEDFVQNDNIQIEPSKIINILKLHRVFLLNLFEYYPKMKPIDEGEALLDSTNKIDGFINYLPTSKKLSSGENALLNLFSRFYDFISNNLSEESKSLPDKKHYIILLDEADLAFHPSWKRKFVKSIISAIPFFFHELKQPPSLQIIFTTHDPLTLSDIPQNNIIYLDKDPNDIAFINQNKAKSFGANVHDLLADSFFLEDGFMGEFAQDWITDLIRYLTPDSDQEDQNENKSLKRDWSEPLAQQVINVVDESLIKERLQNLFDEKFIHPDKNRIEAKIRELKIILKNQANEED